MRARSVSRLLHHRSVRGPTYLSRAHTNDAHVGSQFSTQEPVRALLEHLCLPRSVHRARGGRESAASSIMTTSVRSLPRAMLDASARVSRSGPVACREKASSMAASSSEANDASSKIEALCTTSDSSRSASFVFTLFSQCVLFDTVAQVSPECSSVSPL